MVTTTDLLQLVYEELVALLDEETDVDHPHQHVDIFDRTEEVRTPFFGFEWSAVANERGFGGNRRVVEVEPDSSSGIVNVTIARDYTMTIDLGAVVDGDAPRERTEHMEAIQSHFSDYIDDPEDLHEDVDRVREDIIDVSPELDTMNSMARVTFEIDYTTYDKTEAPAAETVSVDLDADNVDTYPEEY